jgi:hypothetical protein
MSRLSIALALFVAFTLSTVAQAAGPAEGTWTWETPGRGDRPAQKYTLKLTQEGEKLTGKLTVPGRGENAQPRDLDISEGSFKDGTVAFNVVRPGRDNQTMTIKYSGKLEGDTITGQSTSPGRDGGAERKMDWKATRSK